MPDSTDQTMSNPQELVDAALGSPPEVTPPTPVVPVPATTPISATTPPAAAPEMSMGDETPLAFVSPIPPTPPMPTPETHTPTPNPPPVVPPAPIPSPPKKKRKIIKILGVILGIILLIAGLLIGGYYAYLSFGGAEIPSINVFVPKFMKVGEKTIKNPDYDPNQLVEQSDGTLARNEDQRNKELDIKQPQDTSVDSIKNKDQCGLSGKGQWCESVDSNGKPYAFCMSNTGSQGNCNNRAVELGYAISYGAKIVACNGTQGEQCTCGGETVCFDKKGACDHTTDGKTPDGLCAVYDKTKNAKVVGEYFCTGMTEETQNGCQIPGKPVNPKCFCGTIQVDGPTGFTSTTMKCGCDKESTTPTTVQTTTSSMSCTGITRAPTTEPAIGDKLTFTCSGSVTPATAVLSYKFRYSVNGGVYSSLTNKTATTAELSVAACGTYSVQCQVCATLDGVLTCDPTWTGATQ